MSTLPYNLQGKGVAEVSGITISEISATAPKWKPKEEEEHIELQVERGVLNKPRRKSARTSSIQNTAKRSPSSPTSTSTLSSFHGSGGGANSQPDSDPSFDEGGGGPRELRNPRAGVDVIGGSIASSVADEGSGFSGVWGGLYPVGDGNLLPWIMNDTDVLGCGLKHLLQSGNPSDFEETGGLGIGIVDHQVSGINSISISPLVDTSSDFGSSIVSGLCGKERNTLSVLPNFGPDGIVNGKVVNELSHVLGNNGVTPSPFSNSLSFPVPLQPGGANAVFQPQLNLSDEKLQNLYPDHQLLLNQLQSTQGIQSSNDHLLPSGACRQQDRPFQPPLKCHNPGAVIDSNLVDVSKSPIIDPSHGVLLQKQQQKHAILEPLRSKMVMDVGTDCGQIPQQNDKFHQNSQQLQDQALREQLCKAADMGFPHHLPPQYLEQKHAILEPLRSKMVMDVGTDCGQIPQQNDKFHQNSQQLQDQALLEQLCKAADLIHSGKFSLAQEILARLNHQLSFPIPICNVRSPLVRACFYVKEALQLLLSSNPVSGAPPKCLTPLDVVHKLNAYKVFSEVSPISQFMNFTCTQAVLEAVGDSNAPVHVLDFDIGCGAQWASLIQELPLRKRGSPSLRITAFTSLARSHPFELTLVRECLIQFANEVGIGFDLQVVNFESFDPTSSTFPGFRPIENETVAVSLPVWTCSNCPYLLPSLLRFIKQTSPTIILSFDRGSDRWDLSFTQHVIHSLDSSTNLLESLDGLSMPMDVVLKFEKFYVQPRIESTLLGRVQAPDKMPHWKHLFASTGLLPLPFSNFTEAQGNYLAKRNMDRGFHVEQRQGSLVLTWQRREIVVAFAWQC